MSEGSPEQYYAHSLGEGVFRLQRSRSTGRAVFPPRLMVPGDGAQDLEWFEPSGRGVLYSYTTVAQRPPAAPYTLCIVDLEEGARMLARLEGADEPVIGEPVAAAIDTASGKPVVVFRPTGRGA